MKSNSVGSKIAAARKKGGMSQAQLAERLFISAQAVGKWERGESLPDILTMNRLAEILGVDLNYFSESFSPEANQPKEELSIKQPSTSASELLTPSKTEETDRSWDMSRENLADIDFSGLKNLHEKFSGSNMQRCLFVGSNMSGLLLQNNNVENCDFTGSDLGSSRIQGSNLSKNTFRRCSLQGATLYRTNVEGCDFSGADFRKAEFKAGAFGSNTVDDAVWNRTTFVDMHIDNMVFEGTVENCFFENCSFSRVKFQNATLVNTFFKNNRRLKKIQFVDCKVDKMTYAFLRNGQADLSGITLLTT